MLINSPYISGSQTTTGNAVISGSLTVLGSIIGAVTGSTDSASFATTASYASNAELLDGFDSTYFTTTASFVSASASFDTRVLANSSSIGLLSSSFLVASASFDTRALANSSSIGLLSSSFLNVSSSYNSLSASYVVASSSFDSRILANSSSIGTLSSSFLSTSSSLNSRVGTIESHYATTGSNNFTNTQYISATNNAISFTSTASFYTDGGVRITKDMYVSGNAFFNNVTVFGTQSISYITSSQLNIGTNLITVNTDTPSIRFGGLAVYDSGSTGLTGSLLWDSEDNHWVYANPSGSSYDGGMMISGPRNSSGLGNEQGVNACALIVGQGGDHVTSSAIMHYGNATCFYGNSYVSSSGDACFANTVCSSIVIASTCMAVRAGAATSVVNNIAGAAANNHFVLKRNDIQYASLGLNASDNFTIFGTSTSCPRVTIDGNGNIWAGNITSGYINGLLTVGNLSADSKLGIVSAGSPYLNIINFGDGGYGDKVQQVADSSGNFCIQTRSGGTGALCERVHIANTGIAYFACQVCVPNIISTGVSGGRYATFNAPTNGGYITFEAGGTPFGDIGSYCAQYGTGDATTLLLGSRTGYALSLGTNSTERVRITSAGCVSVGTTCTLGRLTVASDAGTSGITLLNTTAATVGTETQFITWEGLTNGSALHACPLGRIGVINVNGGTSIGTMVFYTKQYNAGICERMRITSDGNVGIGGLPGDGYKLQVVGTSQAQTTISQTYAGVSAAAMKITSGGDWAVGVDLADGGTNRFRITSTGIACFACRVCAPVITAGAGTSSQAIKITGDDNYIEFDNAGTYVKGGGNLSVAATSTFLLSTSANTRLTIAPAGEAIFACTVVIKRAFNSAYGALQISGLADVFDNNGVFRVWNAAESFVGGSGTDAWAFSGNNTDYAIYGNNDLYLYSNGNRRLKFTGCGVACFACQVCAPLFRGAFSSAAQCSFSATSAGTNYDVTIPGNTRWLVSVSTNSTYHWNGILALTTFDSADYGVNILTCGSYTTDAKVSVVNNGTCLRFCFSQNVGTVILNYMNIAG